MIENLREMFIIAKSRKYPKNTLVSYNSDIKIFFDDIMKKEGCGELEAIKMVKEDMESPRVMDRIICGDVGYGKTEVAMRATFKAVADDKQVLILTPTTGFSRPTL